MIEEKSNKIFFGSADALVYLTEPMNKTYSTIFVWGYAFSTYVSHDPPFY